jgi:chitinase
MQRNFLVGIVLFFVLSLLNSSTKAQSDVWTTAYYAGWMQGWTNNGYLPAQNIDYDAMTHIIHFSLVPNSNGTLNAESNSITLTNSTELITRAHAKGKKVLISVGGWNSGTGFRGATSAVYRAIFVSNLVTFITTRGYDGIDIDWEPLQSSDAAQYVAFINALRTALNSINPRPLLTAAVGGSSAGILSQVHQSFDQINIMTYDYSGAWGGWVTWHNSPVYNDGYIFPSTGGAVPSANGDIDRFISSGIPKSKLGIGIDFYGYVWNGGSGTSTGGATEPRQSWTTAPSVQGNIPYYTIMQNYYQPQYYRWDAGPQAAYLSIDNSGSSNDKFITYDNQTTVQKKFEYARSKGIGGLIIWELGGGYRANLPAGQRDSLLQAVKTALNGGGGNYNPPPAPVLTSPLNGATNISITPSLSWNVPSGASSYRLQVSANSSFSSTVVNQPNITGTSYNLSGLQNNTKYYWRVNASNSAGTGGWSNIWNFTTAASPDIINPTVSITSPVNGSTVSGTITVSASASDNIGVAGVQLLLNGTNLGPELTTSPYNYSWNTLQVSNGSHTISAVARDAAGNTGTASVTVMVSNSGGTGNNLVVYNDALQTPWINNSWSANIAFNSTEQVYSGTRSAKVTTNAWGALSIHHGSWGSHGVNPSAYQKLEFASYAPVSGTRFTIFFENDLGQSFPKINYGTLAVNQWVVISLPMSQMNPNGFVISRISIQEISGSTKTFYVDEIRLTGSAPPAVPPAPLLVSPLNNATGAAANQTVSWNNSVGAVSYRLQVSTGSAFSTNAFDQSGITATSFALNGLANNTKYYWRVNASNSSGTSIWSSVFNFTTADSVTGSTGTVVYEESLLSPWINTSWNATVNFNSTEQKYEGSKSIKVVQGAWGALRLHSGQWGNSVPVNTTSYDTFEFAVHGGAVGISVCVFFQNDQAQSFPSVKNNWVQPNQWQVISIPISQLNPNNQIVHSVVIQDLSGRQRTYYVDNIRFRNSSSLLKDNNLATETGETIQTPESFSLDQNYPNPFNPTTVISFSLPEANEVTLKIYNLLGEEVATLISGVLSAGNHQVRWDAGSLASGIYVYRLQAGNQVLIKKMNFVK